MLLIWAGRSAACPQGAKLCFLDIWQLILGLLSLRELAAVTPTCQGFRDVFDSRVEKEWERFASVARATFGQELVSDFVKKLHSFIWTLETQAVMFLRDNRLVMNAHGVGEVMTATEFEAHIEEGRVFAMEGRGIREGCEAIISEYLPTYVLCARLWRKLPESGKVMMVGFRVFQNNPGVLHVNVYKDAGEAAMGLLLAICTTNCEAMPLCLQGQGLKAIRIQFEGPLAGPTKKFGEDLVNPLRSLAEQITYHAPLLQQYPLYLQRHGLYLKKDLEDQPAD